ncbi:MAG: acetyl-CoA carboxylase biotin carboxyl carrier protein, partial [Planctomycetes bacterium]|nr:acetyl-CoA carboxylase biotin carboxyl carrier protein [Planctomycetota bacterium]
DKFLSPMVGTLYRAPSPEAKPFVMEGDTVKADSVLCIIEAMKVLNEIKAEKAGKIVQILVENGEAVEYGQPLFLIQPS